MENGEAKEIITETVNKLYGKDEVAGVIVSVAFDRENEKEPWKISFGYETFEEQVDATIDMLDNLIEKKEVDYIR